MLQGYDHPFVETREVPDIKVCYEQLGKLLDQPLPKNVTRFQASCIIFPPEELKT